MVRLIKVVLGIAGVLALVLLGGGLMLSPKFTVTRSADIAVPPEKVYALVASPREWSRWAVWHWFALHADRMVGTDFEAGLAKLKSTVEQ
jgi:hypothetical protein